MTFFLILFFLSLAGIILMIGRKLMLPKEALVENPEDLFEAPNVQEIKQIVLNNLAKFGHQTLLITLRYYIISVNFLKQRKNELSLKIKDLLTKKHIDHNGEEKHEPSKFIKIVSEYKHKVRKITHKIKQEEGIE